MLIKNQVYEARIVDYTADGQGVAKIEGCAVFVANGVVGDLCKIAILKANKTRALGKITQVIEKSPHRINRECPVAKLCGGCDFWHMTYEEECRLKADRVKQNLNRLAGENLEEISILSAPTCYSYRNKYNNGSNIIFNKSMVWSIVSNILFNSRFCYTLCFFSISERGWSRV